MAHELKQFLLLTVVFLLALALSYILTRLLIVRERKDHVEQQIHRLIVETHRQKKGTPTLGGIAMVASLVLLTLLFNFRFLLTSVGAGMLFLVLSFFAVGLFDDLKKVKEKKEDGLKPLVRIGLELGASFIGLLIMGYSQKTRWGINLPFAEGFLKIGYLLPFFLAFIMVGSANANNLTDGLDGLSAGVTMIALTPFIFFAIFKGEMGTALFLLTAVGATLGFLLLNLHPAKIFMGDSGSLALGALLGSAAIACNRLPELALIGGVFVIECLSVIIQVGWYKCFRKRVFLMAPLHHHFELKGWPESRVVMTYYVSALIFAIFGTMLGVRL